ncbi:MAG: chaperone modulator CbpM [Sphingomonadaceae bacterium]
MNQTMIVEGVLLEEAALTLDELAQACAVEPEWVVQHVRTGILLDSAPEEITVWRFTSADLVRARRLRQIERDFDANDDVAALVVDLSEEIRRLRRKLQTAGVSL